MGMNNRAQRHKSQTSLSRCLILFPVIFLVLFLAQFSARATQDHNQLSTEKSGTVNSQTIRNKFLPRRERQSNEEVVEVKYFAEAVNIQGNVFVISPGKKGRWQLARRSLIEPGDTVYFPENDGEVKFECMAEKKFRQYGLGSQLEVIGEKTVKEVSNFGQVCPYTDVKPSQTHLRVY